MCEERWPDVPLREIASEIKDGTHGTHTRVDEGIPLLSAKNINEHGRVVFTNEDEKITKFDYRIITSHFLPRKGDLLVTVVGSLGRVALFEDGDKVAFQRSVAFVRPNNLIEPSFLYQAGRAIEFKRQMERRSNATAQAGLYLGELAKIRIPFPEIIEQKKIAEILSTLDEAIEQTEALIAKHQQIKSGLMQGLFTRGVTPDGRLRPPREEAPELYKESVLGWIPKEWKVKELGELFRRRAEKGFSGIPIMSITMTDGLVPRDSVDRRVETQLKEQDHLLVKKGDIAYNMMRMWQGVLGRAKYDCLVSPAYIVMSPLAEIDSEFAEQLLSRPESIAQFKKFSYGLVDDRLRLYPRDLKKIPLAIPKSIEEQKIIFIRISGSLNWF